MNTKFSHLLGLISSLILSSLAIMYVPGLMSYFGHTLSTYINTLPIDVQRGIIMTGFGLGPAGLLLFATCGVIDCSTSWDLNKGTFAKALAFWLVLDCLISGFLAGAGSTFMIHLAMVIFYIAAIVYFAALFMLAIGSLFFFKRLGNILVQGAKKLNVVNVLTNKVKNFFMKKSLAKEEKKAIENLASINTEETQNSTSIFNHFKSMINVLVKKESSHVGLKLQATQTLFNEMANEVAYIESVSSVASIEAKNDVLSLINKTLPQILVSYEIALKNASIEEKINKTEQMNATLLKLKSYLKEASETLKEVEKSENGLSFDSTLQFAENRFKLKNTQ